MKCLLVSPDFPPPFEGGSLVYIYNLIEFYPGRVDVFTAKLQVNLKEIDMKHKIIRSRFLTGSFNPTKLQLLVMYVYMPFWILFANLFSRYDIIITSAGLVGNCITAIVSKLLRVPAVGVGYAEELIIPMKRKGLKNFIKRTLMEYSYNKFNGFIACCHFTKGTANTLGIPEDKIEVFPVMLNDRKGMEIANEKIKNINKKHQILTVGRLVERKGFHFLIEAVKLLKDEIPDVELYIVGRGAEEKRLENLIKRYKLEKNVFLTGVLSEDELSELYKKSAVFVLANVTLPNGDTEGCPTVFIEASAHGIPVIGGINCGASDAVDDGATGYLVNPRDIETLKEKIKELLLNPELAEKMGEMGRIKVRNGHSSQKAGQRLEHFLERIINEKR